MAGIGIGSVWEVGSVEAKYESPNPWAAFSSEDEEESDEEDSPSDDGEESDEELMESLIRANMAHATATPHQPGLAFHHRLHQTPRL